jgi:hypothetical protein
VILCAVDIPGALVNSDITFQFTKMSLLCSLILLVDCFGPRPIASGCTAATTNLAALTRNLQDISSIDMQITNELCEDSITKAVCEQYHKQQMVYI